MRETATTRKRRKALPGINLPDAYGNTAHTIIGKHILFVNIDADQDAENPCKDMDGFGQIRSLSTRHIDSIAVEEATELLQSDADVIPLSYFEHGNSLWFVQNSTAPAGVEFQWDGTRFAGVWIPDECVRESYTAQDGLSRRDWMEKQAASACETYTQFINGEVFGYNVELFELKTDESGEDYTEWDDYRFKKSISEDSCWGFFGWEQAIETAEDAIRSALSELGYSKRAISKAKTV